MITALLNYFRKPSLFQELYSYGTRKYPSIDQNTVRRAAKYYASHPNLWRDKDPTQVFDNALAQLWAPQLIK